jgi:hypothetical protein
LEQISFLGESSEKEEALLSVKPMARIAIQQCNERYVIRSNGSEHSMLGLKMATELVDTNGMAMPAKISQQVMAMIKFQMHQARLAIHQISHHLQPNAAASANVPGQTHEQDLESMPAMAGVKRRPI